MRVCLFEDHLAQQLEPLTQTRPVFDLLFGQSSLAEKQFRYFRSSSQAALVRSELVLSTQHRHPTMHINDAEWLSEGPCVLVNARWSPPCVDNDVKPGIGTIGEEIAYIALTKPPKNLTVDNLSEHLNTWLESGPRHEATGRMFSYLWEFVEHNSEQLVRDWEFSAPARAGSEAITPTVVGPRDRLVQAPSARIDPMVVADTTMGPVIVDRDVVIKPFTRLEGPCYIGRGTHLVGSTIRAGTTLGPQCRIGGEVECAIVQGYSNKYHDGFLGHSYLGEWVNLAAGTQTSDLRHDYGEISVVIGGAKIPTGLTKVGCFLGDHIKTGLTTFLNTGANVGAFCRLFPTGRYCPKYMPAFMDWNHSGLSDQAGLDSLLETAAIVMSRRGVNLAANVRAMYEALFEAGTAERQQQLTRQRDLRNRKAA